MSHCSPRKAMGGAMSMPTRNSKGPMRNRFKMGGGNFPDLSGDGKVTQKENTQNVYHKLKLIECRSRKREVR